MSQADTIIALLGLAPHPEGGYYRQTWRADNAGRAVGTSIYFLLKSGEPSHWHYVDATEIWHYYAGAPLTLSIAESEAGPAVDHQLGIDFSIGEFPQIIVPANHWQAAKTCRDFTLVGCTVSPGFEFENFTLAPPDFDIQRG